MQETNSRNEAQVPSISFSHMLWIFFDAILKFFRHFILFVSRNLFLLLLFVIAGVVAGISITSVSKPRFLFSMMVKHTELKVGAFGLMLDELDKLASEGSDRELAQTLKLPESISRDISSIKGKNMLGLPLSKDTSSQAQQLFVIDLVVNNNNSSAAIRKAMLSYFNNNAYLLRLKNDRIQLNHEKLRFIESELQQLDSLKGQYNTFLASSGKNAMFYNNAFNPVDLYRQSDTLQRQKAEIREWLRQNSESIVSIDGIKSSAIAQTNEGLLPWILNALLFGLIFFLLGCLVAAIRSVVKAAS
jgi:hypothetical protein